MPSRSLQSDWFEALLRRLDPDRDRAGARYQEIRNGLVRIFRYRGFPNPEDLADEALDRVARRVAEPGGPTSPADLAAFARGVAVNVAHEAHRRPQGEPLAHDPVAPLSPHFDREPRLRCLDRCLAGLAEDDRRVALAYYALEKAAGIAQRASLASERGLTRNAMRIRMCRLADQLERCIGSCLGASPTASASPIRFASPTVKERRHGH